MSAPTQQDVRPDVAVSPSVTLGDKVRGALARHRRRTSRVASPVAAILKYASLVVAVLVAVALAVPLGWWIGHTGRGREFAVAVGNTVVILVLAVVGAIIFGTMVAYALDRFRFRGRKIVMSLFLTAALVPAVTTQVATFKIINFLGIFNTRWAMVLLFVGTDIIAIQIFIQFMGSISRSLDEAAMLDGANRFRIYRSIILPLLRPAIATVVIIKGIAIYNEFYLPFLYMPSPDLPVLSTVLFRFKGPMGSQWELIAASTIIVIIPTLLAFLFLQRFIYSGLTSGATK